MITPLQVATGVKNEDSVTRHKCDDFSGISHTNNLEHRFKLGSSWGDAHLAMREEEDVASCFQLPRTYECAKCQNPTGSGSRSTH
eukprot:3066859-Rhodomonas_salina.2